MFEYTDDPSRVVIDLSKSHVCDASTVAALDAIETKYTKHGTTVELVGLNEASGTFHGRLTGQCRRRGADARITPHHDDRPSLPRGDLA